MIISDLIIAFKKAWHEINKDKIRSKEQIKAIKSLANEWKKRTEDIKNVENLLTINWKYLPIAQRKDYIQKTVDLIHYGFDVEYHKDGTRTYHGAYDYGLIKIYEYIYETLIYGYSDMKDFYNSKDYEYVNQIYENSINNINEKLKQYHILENNNG